MYGYCYICPIQLYKMKLTYKAHTMQLEEKNS